MKKWVPRVYVSGPITKGDRNHNFAQAATVEKRLMLSGFAPLNPMRSMIVPHAHDADLPHDVWMQADLPWVSVAEAVLRLPGESVGADEECGHAKALGIPVFDSVEALEEWRQKLDQFAEAGENFRKTLAETPRSDYIAREMRRNEEDKPEPCPCCAEPEVSFTYYNIPFEETTMQDGFAVKDSGKRASFASGMVRDTTEGKVDFHRVLDGPLVPRLATHLTKGAVKYPDLADGSPNWTLADGEAELQRFRRSAFRHFVQWFRGDVDEDHFAATVFNLNGAEYVKERICERPIIADACPCCGEPAVLESV